MSPLEDTLTNLGLGRIAHEIGMTKMAIDRLANELRFQRELDDLRKPNDFIKKAEESDALIRENFKEWRDYLHKYLLIMISITGFFTALLSAKWTRAVPDLGMIYAAFGLMGASIVVGLIAIFATIFIEKKIIDARVLFALPAVKKRDPRIHPVEMHKMDAREAIAENEAKLRTETDKDEIAWLKLRIKANGHHLKLMNYVTAPSEWFDYVRLGTTALMMGLSLLGIGLLMRELLVHAVNTVPVTPVVLRPQG